MNKMKPKDIVKWIIEIPAKIYNRIEFVAYHVKIPSKTEIHGRILIRGHGKIILGKNNIINSGFTYNPTAGVERTAFLIYQDALLSTGKNVGLSNVIISARSSITIGDYSIVGAGAKLYDHDFHPLDYRFRNPDDENKIQTKPINIGKHVFIGAECLILKGVSVGDNSIIGAGSVVSKDIPANEIWAGNPARFIRRCEEK